MRKINVIVIVLISAVFLLVSCFSKLSAQINGNMWKMKTDSIINNKVIDFKSLKGFGFEKAFPPFEKVMPEQDVNDGRILFVKIPVSGLKEEFLIDFVKFKNVIENNSTFSFCKFYLLDDNGMLSLGLAFSNNQDLDLSKDVLFELEKEEFVKRDFSAKRNRFIDAGGMKDQIQKQSSSSKATEMILFKYPSVRNYNGMISHAFKIEKLRFRMLCLSKEYAKKVDDIGRVSFAVKPYMSNLKDEQTIDYNAGDLKP
ncbi:hypothetical protein ACM39_09770 [Chryseobacterium sp. FH2]|uniref:hypothetical protein n=1 Tax=Chryseobacterium sp. FH2 TaxID=1674291 RepID=UPI00065AE50E|nr:hypothetical protein [Chryseobacterium sp. FH2]KMQ68131.1 hypothetical protein ACM39_09770 [Chryseobacterium sp. FH2]